MIRRAGVAALVMCLCGCGHNAGTEGTGERGERGGAPAGAAETASVPERVAGSPTDDSGRTHAAPAAEGQGEGAQPAASDGAGASPDRRAPTAAHEPGRTGFKEVFPGVRVDVGAGLVEFDGIVPIDAHDPETPVVYLEVVACTPDTKEHEALVMTEARPSHVHAALLLIGLEPGAPGGWAWEGEEVRVVPPRGDGVEITLEYADERGEIVRASPEEWVVLVTGARFGADLGAREPRWIFAGSVMRRRAEREVYAADETGVLIGLTTFGTETIGWSRVLSPDSTVQEPEWIADAARVPRAGTRVAVRVGRAGAGVGGDGGEGGGGAGE